MRSVGSTRWGEVNRPVRTPAARKPAAIMAQVEPLPLVPAMWTIAVSFLRIAQSRENRADAVEAQLGGFHFVAQRVQELDGIGIVHVFLFWTGCAVRN